ncbi:MAG: AzlC family ABC transporter permease [Chloroflexi bacterium]|nr:AzlC family ABC transporter permease [Chloroflexota bacterium]
MLAFKKAILKPTPIQPNRKSEFWAGVRATLPLVVGAIPFGLIFGAVAVTSGITPAGTSAMSAIVFAGSSQFIAAGLVASGASTAIIVVTTLVVNLRHALYAATLAPHMKHLPQRWLLPLGFWLTDESFLVTANRFDQADKSPFKHWFFLGSAIFMYSNWQIVTFIGIIAGQAIPDPRSWGLDFAMIVTFIGMLVPLVKNRPTLIAILVAGITALLSNNLPNQLGLIIAALLGILAGVVAENLLPEDGNEAAKDE